MAAGPFYLKRDETASHNFKMPNYIGSVRTMVIAKDHKAYGKADQTSYVKKPLMLLPTLPRVTSPAEVVKVPVTVFAMEDHIKSAKVTMAASPNVEIIGPSTKRISFSEVGDKIVYFDARLKNEMGIASFDFTASSGAHSVSQQVEVDIRNPNPVRSEVFRQTITDKGSWATSLDQVGMSGTRSGTIEFSSLPSLNLEDRMGYLISYPYGCAEQTTSRALPQLALGNFKELSHEESQEIKKNVNAAIRRLSRMQRSTGGFSYWPGNHYVNDWASSYAGFFLMQAQKESYHIPGNMLSKWISYQQGQARRFKIDRKSALHHQQYQMRNQAYRLMTMAVYGSPDLAAMNALRQETNLPATVQFMLAAAYAYAGKKELAIELTRSTDATVAPYQELGLSYGSDLRDMSLIALAMLQLNLKNEGLEIVKRITEQLNSRRWYSTQTIAQALIAVSEYMKHSDSRGLNFTVEMEGMPQQTISTDKPVFTLAIDPDIDGVISPRINNLTDCLLYTSDAADE